LQGETIGGDPFEGTGAIVTVACVVQPATLSVTDVDGGASAFAAYDLSGCWEAENVGFNTMASADWPIASNPDCDGFSQYASFIYHTEASTVEPVYTNYSISTQHYASAEQNTSDPYFILGSGSSNATLSFTVSALAEFEVAVEKDGEGSESVRLTQWSEIAGPEYIFDFDPGVSTVTLVPGQYTLTISFSNGIGGIVDNSGTLSVRASIVSGVEIDVDPWSPANIVKPDSNDQIHVLVMGSNTATGDATDFDVYQIDPDSLKFGVGEAPSISGYPLYGDPDNDSNTDALFAFQTQDTGILCDDPDVTLLGETFSGDPFAGTDAIETTDCDTGGCHP
jgi:hypothetical protein